MFALRNKMSLHTGIEPSKEIDVLELNLPTKKYVDDKLTLKVDKAGDTITGPLSMDDGKIWDLSSGSLDTNAVNKKYVDDADNLKLAKTGGTLSGELSMDDNKITDLATPTADTDASTKKYVDDQDTVLQTSINLKLSKLGGDMTGDLDMGDNKITDLATPTNNSNASTKKYVDDKFSSVPNGSNYMIFEFPSTSNNTFIQSRNLNGFMFWTNDRAIKITILAHVFDSDSALSNLNLYYRVVFWTKNKTKRTNTQIFKTNVNEYVGITGVMMQTFGIFKSITLTDISCFTLEYKYFHTGNLGNESSVHCLVEYI